VRAGVVCASFTCAVLVCAGVVRADLVSAGVVCASFACAVLVCAVRARLLAKACRGQAVALAEGACEIRRLAKADEPRDVAHWDRRLLGQQLRSG
jgi:hypothetical protein